MPKRRATRAAVAKRPDPVISDDADEAKNLSVKERRNKAESLIKDFETEMVARKKSIHEAFQGVIRQLDRAYTMGLIQITPQSRNVLFSDFLLSGSPMDAAVVKPAMNDVEAVVEDMTKIAVVTKDEEEDMETTSKTVRKTRKTKGRAPATARKTRGNKVPAAQMLVTPGNSASTLTQWNTPLITPKFDPRLFRTPAVGAAGPGTTAGGLPVTRTAKPGEVTVSMDGSPILNQPLVTDNAVVVPLSGELNVESLDEDSVHGIFGAVEKLYKSLKAVVDYPTQQK